MVLKKGFTDLQKAPTRALFDCVWADFETFAGTDNSLLVLGTLDYYRVHMRNKNLPLIVGLVLPLLFIAVLSGVLFVPSVFVNPQHNFIYAGERDYSYYRAQYSMYGVTNGQIVFTPAVPEEGKPIGNPPKLYLYDVKSNSSHEISLDDAKKIALDPGPSSPDGYTVSYLYGHDGIFELFGSNGDRRGYFISKGAGKKRLSGIGQDMYQRGDIQVIGWVK